MAQKSLPFTRPALGILFVAFLAVGSLALLPAWGSAPAPGYTTEVDIEPSAKHPGAFMSKVVVKDLAGEVLSAPTLMTLAGEEGEARTQLDAQTVVVRVSVDKDGQRAGYSLALSADGKERLLHRGSFRLKGNG